MKALELAKILMKHPEAEIETLEWQYDGTTDVGEDHPPAIYISDNGRIIAIVPDTHVSMRWLTPPDWAHGPEYKDVFLQFSRLKG